MVDQKERSIPIRWFDLVHFDPQWIKDKRCESVEISLPDGRVLVTCKVYDKENNLVWDGETFNGR